ncbi:hypothetical protein PG993_007164 [Apiospora rasikravindrae]|uniref:Uncharacterized protein n=1 Tax=Apiospora rasikravindrae TaxID=990691 RepID=A0ABR1SWR9_9PEZI
MPLLCCCRGRQVPPSSQQASTPEPELPARPAHAKPSDVPYSEIPTGVKAVAANHSEAPSRIRTPMKPSTVDLSSLEVEDSDDGHDGAGLGSAKHSSTSTLEVLKARFIRRLSQLSERNSGSRHTPCSEGELARRAELKRLRQKRIEEELKDEQEAERKTIPRDCRDSSGHHGGELPGGGPRDTIEFGVTGPEGAKSDNTLVHDAHQHPQSIDEVVTLARRRRRSFSDVGSHKRHSSHESKSLREYRSLPQMPSPPRLQPVYLPSVYSSNSIASWRLSYSASNLVGSPKQSMESTSNLPTEDPIEEVACESPPAVTLKPRVHVKTSSSDFDTDAEKALERETSERKSSNGSNLTSPATEIAATIFDMGKRGSTQSTIGRHSPLDMWLQIQGLELSRCSTSDPSAGMTDSGGEAKPIVPPASKTSGITGLSADRREPSPHRVAQSAASGPGLDPLAQDGWQIRENTDHSSEKDLGMYLQQRRSMSSHYTTQSSNPRSPPPLPVTMTPNSLMYRGIYITHPTPDIPQSTGRTTSNDGSDTSSYKTALDEASRLHPLTALNNTSLRRPTDETVSSILSETESFKQREAELLSVAKRFAGADAGRYQGSHTVSKFREEFDTPRKSKPAILSKLHIPKVTKSLRKKREKTVLPHQDSHHRNCVAAALDASQAAAAGPNASLVPRNAIKQKSGQWEYGIPDSATNVWQRAVRLEADRRDVLRRDREKFHASSNTDLSTAERPQSTPVDRPLSPRVEARGLGSASEVYLPLRPTMPPPKSWARWPSHTRAARNGPAQQHDSIRPKDFAVDRVASTGPKDRAGSLTGKVGKAIRKSIAWIMPGSDGDLGSTPIFSADSARRGRPGGYLEYPELELLPMAGGYKELEALERQINHIKRPSENQSTPLPSPNRSPRIPLGQRLADEVHRFQHSGRAGTPEANERPMTLPLPKLTTPTGMHLTTPRIVSEVTTHYETPKSHLSYEDCVPRHMLDDDEGSSKSDDSPNVRRSKSNIEHRGPGQAKYGTWNGRTRAKAEPVLRKSTHEFGVELEKLLDRERDKALDVGVKREDAKSPGGSKSITIYP